MPRLSIRSQHCAPFPTDEAAGISGVRAASRVVSAPNEWGLH